MSTIQALPVCPNCKNSINELCYRKRVTTIGSFSVTEGFEQDPIRDEDPRLEFSCYECGKLLFKSKPKALKFLKQAPAKV